MNGVSGHRPGLHLWNLLRNLGLSLLLVSPGYGTSAGQLGGVVVDDAGNPLVGVQLEVRSPVQIGGPLQTTSDSRGRFLYPRLAPGSYQIEAEHDGYLDAELDEIEVRLDGYSSLRIVMAPAAIAAAMNVSSTSPQVDPQQVSIGETFTAEYLTETRTQWYDLLSQVAGTQPEDSVRIFGSTPEANAYRLDGLDATGWTFRIPNQAVESLPFDALQEVAVHTGAFEARYGQATGGVVNLVTRSGGNAYRLTVDGRHGDASLQESGRHYDAGQQDSRDQRFSVTFGGPVVRDRLWFFTVFDQQQQDQTATGAASTEERDRRTGLAKLTWSSGRAWTLSSKAIGLRSRISGAPSDPVWGADATTARDDDALLVGAELVGQLSSRFLLQFRLGYRDRDVVEMPSHGDLAAIGHHNLTTNEISGSSELLVDRDIGQEDLAADLSWFFDGLGSHEVAIGGSLGAPEDAGTACLTGTGRPCVAGDEGFRFFDRAGSTGEPQPFVMIMSEAEPELALVADTQTFFLQDTWRATRRFTLKPGLRWDRVEFENNVGRVADLHLWQPRVGVAWDLDGRGRNLFRASWGRFMHPSTLILGEFTRANEGLFEQWLSCSRFVASDPSSCRSFAELEGVRYRSDPEGWDSAGWFLPPGNVRGSGVNIGVAENLSSSHAEQWMLGFEREVFDRTTLEVSYLDKSASDLLVNTCVGNRLAPSADADCSTYVVMNLPEARLDYQAWMLRFESRALRRFHLLGSWVVADSKGSLSANYGVEGDFDQYPFHWENRYGYLSDHSRHRVKLNGYLQLPRDFGLAVVGWWSSEQRWTPTENDVPGMLYGVRFLEPRGSRKENGTRRLDLQVWKSFGVGQSRLKILAAIVNVFGNEPVTEFCANKTGCSDFRLGEATDWQLPRSYEAGLRWEF